MQGVISYVKFWTINRYAVILYVIFMIINHNLENKSFSTCRVIINT